MSTNETNQVSVTISLDEAKLALKTLVAFLREFAPIEGSVMAKPMQEHLNAQRRLQDSLTKKISEAMREQGTQTETDRTAGGDQQGLGERSDNLR